jgi:hypothetical protein
MEDDPEPSSEIGRQSCMGECVPHAVAPTACRPRNFRDTGPIPSSPPSASAARGRGGFIRPMKDAREPVVRIGRRPRLRTSDERPATRRMRENPSSESVAGPDSVRATSDERRATSDQMTSDFRLPTGMDASDRSPSTPSRRSCIGRMNSPLLRVVDHRGAPGVSPPSRTVLNNAATHIAGSPARRKMCRNPSSFGRRPRLRTSDQRPATSDQRRATSDQRRATSDQMTSVSVLSAFGSSRCSCRCVPRTTVSRELSRVPNTGTTST